MSKWNLLIADGNLEFSDALHSLLQDAFCIRITDDGRKALELMAQQVPDVLVIDVALLRLDGIRVLEEAAQRGYKMKVLVTTLVCTDHILNKLSKLDISYLLMKPCDLENAVQRVLEIADECTPLPEDAMDHPHRLAAILLELGLKPKHNGYHYLCEAVQVYGKDPKQSLTKEVYTAVATKFGVSWSQVERSIRAAIEAAWKCADETIWRKWFPSGMLSSTKRPANGEVICRLSELLTLEQVRKIG